MSKFKDILKTIAAFFVAFFGNAKKVEDWMIEHADEGIDKGQFILDLLKGPAPEMVKVVTPDAIDKLIDKFTAATIDKLQKVVKAMQGASVCLNLKTPGERIACYINEVRGFTDKRKTGEVLKFASTYAQISAAEAGKEVKESIADTAIQTRLMAKKIELEAAA